MNEVKLVSTKQVLGKELNIYGSVDEPLFLAKDVAEWIEYDKNQIGKMLSTVDEDEKIKLLCGRNNITVSSKARKTQQAWFLTEDGLYEVLMQSRKPIAKQFKKEVKRILKELRNVDEDEKVVSPIYYSGQVRNMWFLTEDEDEKVKNIVRTLGGVQEMWFLTEDGF